MKEAEAKKILERLLSVDIIVGNEHEAVDTAINALEKQIAKKPIDRIAYSNCPCCGEVDIIGCLYCPVCGQKLDWSEV